MIDLFHQYAAQLRFDESRFPVAMLALSLTAVVGAATGPLGGNANPLFWNVINMLFGGIGSRLDRRERGYRDLVTRGFVLTVPALIFGFIIGSAATKLAHLYPVRGITEILLLALVLAGGAVWNALLKLYFVAAGGKTAKGEYYTIAQSSRTDLSGADDYGLTRTGMAFAARSFDKGVVAPVFWYLLTGLTGVYVYAVVVALSWRFGRDGFTGGFGRTALLLERLAGFIPSFLAGILIALAGLFTPTGGMTRAFRGFLRKKGRALYAEGGLPLTAMAYALNVSLGGPIVDLEGRSLKRGWVGPEQATARLDSGHLRRALYIVLMAYLLLVVLLATGMFRSGLG